jgi:protein ImuB
MEVICALVPRFSLIAACGERRELLREPAALAPEPGAKGAVGEVSGAAEAHGVRAGMPLGEALSRCPELTLVPPDPGGAAEIWEGALRRLEGIGAGVESERAGEAFLRADGLRGIHGGLQGTLAASRKAVAMPARVAAAPTRFASYAATLRAPRRRRSRAAGLSAAVGGAREPVVSAAGLRRFLSPLPISILADRLGPDEHSARRLVGALERLGLADLGALAALRPGDVADRFGPLGLRARALACGHDDPPRPRGRHEELAEALELPEAAAGEQLERALDLLIDRLLASPRRRSRTVRSLRFGALLGGGGSWSTELALRRPSASPEVLRLVLRPKLAELPGPAASLTLRAPELGPAAPCQLELSSGTIAAERERRLAEAVRQVRAAAGAGALLRVLEVDGASRVPERWTMLTPFPDS